MKIDPLLKFCPDFVTNQTLRFVLVQHNLFKALEVRVVAYDLKRELVDYSPATRTYVEVLPTPCGFHLIAILIAWIETVRIGPITTQADPGFLVSNFVVYLFFV